MANNSTRRAAKKSQIKAGVSTKDSSPGSSKDHKSRKSSATSLRYALFAFAVVVILVACIVYVSLEQKTEKSGRQGKQSKNNNARASAGDAVKQKVKTAKDAKQPKGSVDPDNLPPEFRNFKASFQKKLKMSSFVNGKSFNIKELQPIKHNSSVRAYVIENFLSDSECDSLMKVHKKHVEMFTQNDPFLCFDSVSTLVKNLRELKLKYKVSNKDFIKGTTCLNETFSSELKTHFKWSYSTAFYPGENKFSMIYAEHIKQATGLNPENGGKFQITSYPVGVGYKSHTDCVVYEKGNGEPRDRFATILVYLQDVEEGGETEFPLLGIKVKPKKGLALVWNSMDEDGNCEALSLHDAKKVVKGHKYIIQRWYYYKSFPALGKRPPEPNLPKRKSYQPRVSCDVYEQGSCRWYDEWNYDHILEYMHAHRQNLV